MIGMWLLPRRRLPHPFLLVAIETHLVLIYYIKNPFPRHDFVVRLVTPPPFLSPTLEIHDKFQSEYNCVPAKKIQRTYARDAQTLHRLFSLK
jgi:hypothetical protein